MSLSVEHAMKISIGWKSSQREILIGFVNLEESQILNRYDRTRITAIYPA